MKFKIAAAAMLMASAMPANATLLINGNFDNGLAGWARSSIGGSTGFVATNSQFFNLAAPAAQFRSGTSNFQTLSQTVDTVIGQRYLLTYSVLNQRSLFNQFDVTTGGSTTSTTFPAAFESGFVTFTQMFIATSEQSLIQFAVNHGGVGGQHFYLDDASLDSVVPEPASWAMLIAGFGLVGAAARRRRMLVTI